MKTENRAKKLRKDFLDKTAGLCSSCVHGQDRCFFPRRPPRDHTGWDVEAVAAEEVRKGLAGALQAAILRLLEAILALLAEFRAGTLAAHGALAAGTPSQAAPGAAEPRLACADQAGDREPPLLPAPSPAVRSAPPPSPSPAKRGRAGVGVLRPRVPHPQLSTSRNQPGGFSVGIAHSGRRSAPVGICPPSRIGCGRPRWPPKKSMSNGVGVSVPIHSVIVANSSD
jgi:hypothetical protein